MSTQDPTTDEFKFLPLAAIVASLTNPRKSFRADKLAELADSIKASGVHQPILVRPLPGSRLEETAFEKSTLPPVHGHIASFGPKKTIRPTHEIVAGERRYRASVQAGTTTIPALIRALTDDQVIEIQLVENLQRDDLTELEEAEGYEQLMARSGLTAEAVGGKIGKSRSYVYARLKLLDLSMECKEAMRAGQIDASRALLIARIPDTKLQTKALAEATRTDWQGEVTSVRTLQVWLQRNVMLKLEDASFRITDSQLVKSAGSCKDCPKRTGANPDLFADVVGADICTDPICYHGKEDAQRASMLATAAAKGMRLIEGTEAKEICHQYHDTLKGYSPLNQVRNDLHGEEEVQLGTMLGKDSPPAVLIENPWTKELIAAVPTAEAEAVLIAKGFLKVVQEKQDSRAELEEELASLKKKTEREIERQSRSAMFEALVTGIRAMPDALACKLITPKFLRAWLLSMVDEWDSEDFASWLAIDLPDGLDYSGSHTHLRLHLQACDSAKLYRVLAISMMVEDGNIGAYWANEIAPITLFPPMAELVGVDLDAIKSNITADVKHDMAETMKRIKADLKALDKAEKPSLPLAPAAQAKTGAGGKGQKTGGSAAPASVAPLRKRKMSSDEAQAAIAAAMQGQDTESGADAQGDDADSSPPVALSDVGHPTSDTALAVGMRVCVTSDTDPLPINLYKWAGKEGTITQQMSNGAWMLTFKGRNGGMASFNGSELLTPRLIKDNAQAKVIRKAAAA